MRILSVPPLARLLSRLDPPSPRQLRRLAALVHVDLDAVPELADLLLATERLPGFEKSLHALLHTLVRLRGARPEVVLTAVRLGAVQRPGLLVWGDNDPFGSTAVAERATRAIPDATLQIVPVVAPPGSGRRPGSARWSAASSPPAPDRPSAHAAARLTGPMMEVVGWSVVMVAGAGAIVWGAETFAEHLAVAAARLGVTAFALALLLAGAEPEELATVVTAALRDVDGVAFGDAIGANAAIATVAIGTGALVTAMPFGPRIRRYALGGLAAALLAAGLSWDGALGRREGAVLVGGYVLFVAAIWRLERRPPALGETAELQEAGDRPSRPIGRELGMVLVGLASLTAGSVLLVEGVRRITGIESTQTRLGLVVVGFATAFELVVLAWSAARRGITEAVVAGVVGSYAYNATMTLGAGALATPIVIARPSLIRAPLVAMVALMAVIIVLAAGSARLDRRAGALLFGLYPVFVAIVFVAT
jgi:cation:H+ antiporter